MWTWVAIDADTKLVPSWLVGERTNADAYTFLSDLKSRLKPRAAHYGRSQAAVHSNRSYNVLFKSKSGTEAQAQIEAFGDTWTWSQESESLFDSMVEGGAPIKVADALMAMRKPLFRTPGLRGSFTALPLI